MFNAVSRLAAGRLMGVRFQNEATSMLRALSDVKRVMESRRGSQKNSLSTIGATSSGTLDDDEDYESSDEDDLYLEPGEPFGAFLAPAERPYDRKERVDTLNQHLQNSQPPTRRHAVRVRIREELNQYFFEDSDSDSIHVDDDRATRKSSRTSRPPSPRYPSGEKQRSSEGQKRPPTGTQRTPTSQQVLDDRSLTNNTYKG